MVYRLPTGLLGGHISGRAKDRALLSEGLSLCPQQTRQPEVQDLHGILADEQDIVGFEPTLFTV